MFGTQVNRETKIKTPCPPCLRGENWSRESRLSSFMVQSRELMAQTPQSPGNGERHPTLLYCPTCAREVDDPLTCGDCSAVICRVCGTPLEMPEDLGIG
jgi:hypothetical protein